MHRGSSTSSKINDVSVLDLSSPYFEDFAVHSDFIVFELVVESVQLFHYLLSRYQVV